VEFATLLETVIPIFRDFKLSVEDDKDTIVDVEARKVVLHLRSSAKTTAGPYKNQYIFILTISEDGEKVDGVMEFLDSKYTAQFLIRLSEENRPA
jgi:ketosteroid isomerase-like protein